MSNGPMNEFTCVDLHLPIFNNPNIKIFDVLRLWIIWFKPTVCKYNLNT